MIDPLTVAYGLGTVGMLVGGVFAVQLARSNGWDSPSAALLVIPGAATLAYLVMAVGVGRIAVGSETILVPRYVDWLLTTPVLVGYVAYLAGAPRRVIAGVAVADAAMIVTGALATVLVGPAKWAFFGVSGLMHLSLLAGLYLVLPRYIDPAADQWRLFRLLQNHVGLLWLVYPVVWVASPSGIGAVSTTAVGLMIAYLDVVAKTPYVYFVWRNRGLVAPLGGDRTAPDRTETGGATPTGD